LKRRLSIRGPLLGEASRLVYGFLEETSWPVYGLFAEASRLVYE
jgi:hypothetical protein